MPDLLYADNQALCSELEKELKVVVRCYVEVFRGLDVNVDKSRVMVLGWEEMSV